MPAKKKQPSGTTPSKTNNSKFADLEKRITPVADLGLVVAACFYGRAGTGKTTLACSFPGPILILDIREKGTDSVSDLENVDMLPVEDWGDIEKVYWYLKSNPTKYKTVIWDAVSAAQDYALIEALEKHGKSEGDQLSKRDFGVAGGLMKTWITNYRDLVEDGINVVFLAHDRTTDGQDGEDGELTPSVGPRLMPSVASALNAAVKMIGNTFIREVTEKKPGGKLKRTVSYCMRLGPHAYYATKIRQPKGSYVPEILEDPSYNDLVSLMKGQLKAPAPVPVASTATKTLKKRK